MKGQKCKGQQAKGNRQRAKKATQPILSEWPFLPFASCLLPFASCPFVFLPFYSHLLRRQIKGHCLMFQMPVVRPIAKGFVFGQAAAAKAQCCPALQSVYISLCVYNFKIALNFERAVGVYRNFCCCHESGLNFCEGRNFAYGMHTSLIVHLHCVS